MIERLLQTFSKLLPITLTKRFLRMFYRGYFLKEFLTLANSKIAPFENSIGFLFIIEQIQQSIRIIGHNAIYAEREKSPHIFGIIDCPDVNF